MFNKEISKRLYSVTYDVDIILKRDRDICLHRIDKLEEKLDSLMEHLNIKFNGPKYGVEKK